MPILADLKEIIIEEIRRKGPITFERFMELALYHTEYGYYMKKIYPFGPEGDYYTSAHLPLFGETLALQAIELMEVLGHDGMYIVEIGPGMGYTAQGILRYLTAEGYTERIKYILVEPNPHLREVQKKNLGAFLDNVFWHGMEELAPRRCLVIANEVLDALPVHIVEYRDGDFKEIYLTERAGEIEETCGPLSSAELEQYISRYSIPEIQGYRTEVCLRTREFLIQLSNIISQGMALLIDYGYSSREFYAPERTKGTLLCYRKHRVDESPYQSPGDKDITSHVNFTSVKDFAKEAGLEPLGFTSQGSYLVGLGIDRLIERKLSEEPAFSRKIPSIKGLLFGMGETHQVLALGKGLKDFHPRGFSISNRLSIL